MTDLSLIDMGLTGQRLSRSLKGYVEVVLNIAGGEWSGEAEIHYLLVPAFAGRDDEPGYGEHIEIQHALILFKETKLDITALVWAYDELHESIQTQILD